ncbi:chromate transporter [Sphaerochaeta sp. PS]|uniref:chromate transporter n=1 Tax=Sphaerochaeta sp. PS TaxID=3076336 RepID=UPI0028A38500|nr:chromate transporter [Sphaerochaeta sp. PS]MDT4761585.1 chromate transporter [Sphaerochaeta sp. PS]
MVLFQLFFEFFKIGLFSIGGGLATLPFIYSLAEAQPTWFSAKNIVDMIAISESTPGPIGINMATYAGYLTAGPLGGLIATIGEVTPSVIIICIIARFLSQFDKNPFVRDAFYGLRAAVIGLIIFAGSKVFAVTLLNHTDIRYVEAALFVGLFLLAMKFKKVHPLIWIVSGAVLGLVLKLPS